MMPTSPNKCMWGVCSVLFSALLASRVGRIMHDVPPTSSVFRHSYQILLCASGPCSYIIHPVGPLTPYLHVVERWTSVGLNVTPISFSSQPLVEVWTSSSTFVGHTGSSAFWRCA